MKGILGFSAWLRPLLKLGLYLAGAWVSQKSCAGYWVVGPVFGAVVLACNARALPALGWVRPAAFLGSSTLIYALVYGIAENGGWEWHNPVVEWLSGAFPAGVVAGSILLPLAHRVFLGSAFRRTVGAWALLIASFYGVTLAALAADRLGVTGINFLAIAVYVWQGVYLAVFFWDRRAGR